MRCKMYNQDIRKVAIQVIQKFSIACWLKITKSVVSNRRIAIVHEQIPTTQQLQQRSWMYMKIVK